MTSSKSQGNSVQPASAGVQLPSGASPASTGRAPSSGPASALASRRRPRSVVGSESAPEPPSSEASEPPPGGSSPQAEPNPETPTRIRVASKERWVVTERQHSERTEGAYTSVPVHRAPRPPELAPRGPRGGPTPTPTPKGAGRRLGSVCAQGPGSAESDREGGERSLERIRYIGGFEDGFVFLHGGNFAGAHHERYGRCSPQPLGSTDNVCDHLLGLGDTVVTVAKRGDLRSTALVRIQPGPKPRPRCFVDRGHPGSYAPAIRSPRPTRLGSAARSGSPTHPSAPAEPRRRGAA